MNYVVTPMTMPDEDITDDEEHDKKYNDIPPLNMQ